MTVLNPTAFLQNGGAVTAQIQRLSQVMGTSKALYTGATNYLTQLGGQGGVWPQANAFNVTAQGTPNMTVNVDRGACCILGTEAVDQGNYFLVNDGVLSNLVIPPSNTSARIDSIIAQVLDQSYSGTSNLGQIVVVSGSPGSGSPPNLATLSKNYCEIWRVNVRANTTSILTSDITPGDVRHWLTAPGGVDIPNALEFSNNGRIPGDMRIRMGAANQRPGSLEYWGSDATWHGASDLLCTNTTYPLADNASVASAAIYTFAQTTVPDPGYPYYVRLFGQTSTYADSHGSAQPIRVRVDNGSTGTIAFAGAHTVQGAVGYGSVQGKTYNPGTPLTGAHTFYLNYEPSAAAAATYQRSTNPYISYLDIEILPA